jgi:hypothetical protein
MPSSDQATAVAQDEIDRLVARLHALVDAIAAARAALAPLEAGLAEAWKEYDDRIRALRLEAAALEHDLASSDDADRSGPDAPTGGDGVGDGAHGPARTPGLAALDADRVEKDILLEHLVRVLDPMLDAQASDLIASVQGRVEDGSYRLADLLESVPWGRAWTESPRSEDPAARLRRLTAWVAALERQLDALRNAEERLRRHDRRYPIFEQRQAGPEAWSAYLDREVRRWEEHNLELRTALEERTAS